MIAEFWRLKDEVARRQRQGAAQPHHKVRHGIAIDIGQDQRIAGAIAFMAKLAASAGEGAGAEIGEGLVAGRQRIGIDSAKIDEVGLRLAEIRDEVGGGRGGPTSPETLAIR